MRPSLVIVLLALGCDRSEPAPPAKAEPTASASAGAGPSAPATGPCGGADVEKTLVDGCTDSPIQDSRKLALAKWTPTHRGPLEGVPIVVTAKGPEVYGQVFGYDSLMDALQSRRAFAKPGEPTFLLAIDADATLGDVQEVVAGLVAAEATSGVLLYGSATLPRTPAALHPEIHVRLTAKIDAMGPSDRAITTARELQNLVAPCAPMTQAFESIATEAPTNRCASLMRAAVKAVASCGCPTWTPELFTWLQMLGGPADAPRIHADTVTLSSATPTKANAMATWSTIVEGRTAAIDTLWLDLAR